MEKGISQRDVQKGKDCKGLAATERTETLGEEMCMQKHTGQIGVGSSHLSQGLFSLVP